MITLIASLSLALAAGGTSTGAPTTSRPPSQSTSRPPQTDQTVAVSRGARLFVENFAGEVTVHTWDRDSLRVQARHASRARVIVRTVPTGVRVSSSAERGPIGSVDYDITAPVWMPIRIEGQFNFVTVEGSQAEVSAETVRGDVVIKGGNNVVAKSVEGDVTVEGARGRINVSSVNEGIVLRATSGEITAETVNGAIRMTEMDASSVEAGTINGNISYEGTAASEGRYRLTSHNGTIIVAVPETSHATFAVRTYQGGFNSALPLEAEGEKDVRHGRRVVFRLGKGGAEFELETFSGSIRLRKPGSTPATPKTKEPH
jgi:hypothetical protein